ncbi:MAG: MFS transporter [bacterium]
MTKTQGQVSSSRAIAAFALGTLFFSYAFVQRVAPSVMTGELMRDFAVGGAALGSLSAWYFYTYATIQLPVGMLTDRFGPRKLMSTAMALCAFASLGFAMSDSLFAASVSRALVGATVGFGFVGTLAIAAYWFHSSRFAMLAGVIQTAGMIGGMLGQAPLGIAVEHVGWRSTMMSLGALAALLSLLLYFVIPRRPRDKNTASPSVARKPAHGVGQVIRNPQSWYCAAIGFGLSSVMLGFVGLWAVPWLSTVQGFGRAEAAGIASMLFLGWALGAPIWGWLSDHLGRRKPMAMVGVVFNIAVYTVILFAGIQSSVLLSMLFFVAGVFGASMTVTFSCIRELNASDNSGTALGLMNMCVVGSGAVTQPLVGWLLDRNWEGVLVEGERIYSSGNYDTALLVFYATNLLALGGVAMMKETYCRQIA